MSVVQWLEEAEVMVAARVFPAGRRQVAAE